MLGAWYALGGFWSLRQKVIGFAPPVWLENNLLLRAITSQVPAGTWRSRITTGERTPLRDSSGVVLGTLGLGFRLGRWPVWAALIAAAAFVAWSGLYSKIVDSKPNAKAHS